MKTRKCMLVILDGWGHREEKKYNAIASARKPRFDGYFRKYPHTLISASGLDVGLLKGLMGNSEVGHLNIGAGRIVWQEITRINKSIEDGPFFENPAFTGAVDHALSTGGRLHLMGLASDGGVHSSSLHYLALIDLAARRGVKADRLFFHAITDGRDTSPIGGLEYIREIERKMRETGIGRIASVVGRYYSMDRDKRYDRLEKAYLAYTEGEGNRTSSWEGEIENNYADGMTDEFCLPMIVVDEGGPIGLIRDGDSVIFFNFRGDRGREITHAFTDLEFPHFKRRVLPKVHWACMTRYEANLTAPVAFPPHELKNVFGEFLSSRGMTQVRIAETEKYAHVTYFFNGGREAQFEGEERLLVASPKAATYDLVPEMSAREVTGKLLDRLGKGLPDFVLVNYANPDMVGHTGIFEAAVKAIETVDEQLGKIVDPFVAEGGAVLITADHGNAEVMFDEERQEPHTAHTTNPVPLILAGAGLEGLKLAPGGRLCDVIPTLGEAMGIDLPDEMEGASLISK